MAEQKNRPIREVDASDLGLLIAAWDTDGSIVEGSDINGDASSTPPTSACSSPPGARASNRLTRADRPKHRTPYPC
jgi:hypothetical protein